MTWQLTKDLDAFDAAASAFIVAKSTHNTVLISVPATLRKQGLDRFGDDPPRFGWFTDPDGEVQGVFVHTPPHPILLSEMTDEAAAGLVGALNGAGWPPAAVNGPVNAAEAVGAAWRAANGRDYTVRTRLRLFVLPELIWPSPMPEGAARVGTAADRELLVRWYREFLEEIHEAWQDPERTVDDRIEHGGLTLWEVDGVPVSLAGNTRPLAGGGIRIGPVYTPKELRGHGYAAAVTAAVSRAGMDAGARVSLFTDLANPTSNGVYKRLGYRPVEDRVVLDFGDGKGEGDGGD